MQLEDAAAGGALVQPVDVLRDDAVDAAGRLERGERAVAGVRLGGGDAPPAVEAARPVAATDVLVAEEVAVLKGLRGARPAPR